MHLRIPQLASLLSHEIGIFTRVVGGEFLYAIDELVVELY